ncbi:uncharacterized protein LOC116805893 isoform X2 [Drosophila grimshawi]|uniref:uncharacterized protein LOC116805893 isoform X2 n=1 Tax=Drosophila grimshawi TaxID=7222 RepID=UPI000C8708BF|nr:uncharacterized protein LOC116805893 isoform X2 [Drosophila grimshawi]
MSAIEESLTRKIEFKNLFNIDLTNSCRICKCEANKENGIKLRPLFNGRRLTRIIANTVHIELDFRRSEEDFNMVIEARENYEMNALHAFAAAIEIEKRQENDQNAAAAVNNLLKEAKKTKKSKPKLQY